MAIKRREKAYKPLVPIHKILTRFPGGNIVIPLIIGCIITTVSSICGYKNIWEVAGQPLQGMFSGKYSLMTFIGLMIFFTGTQTDVTNLKPLLKRGVPLLALKLGVAYLLAFIFLWCFGSDGIFGISFLGFTAGLTCINSAMFMSITNGYADDADRAYFSLAMVFGLPVLPLIAVRGGTGNGIDYVSIISILAPMIFGMILGNLDKKMRRFYEYGTQVIIMFMGFQFGSYIDLTQAFKQIPQALILTVFLYICTLPPFLVERFAMKRSGYASVGMSALAGVSLSMPVLTADIFSEQICQDATYQLAFALAVTAILAPILTDAVNKNFFKVQPDRLKLSCPKLYRHVEREYEETYENRELRYFKKTVSAFRADSELEGLSEQSRLLVQTFSAPLKKVKDGEFKKALEDIPADQRKNQAKLRKEDKAYMEVHLRLLASHVARKRMAALEAMEGFTAAQRRTAILGDSLLDPYRKGEDRKELDPKERARRLLELYDGAAFEVEMEDAKGYLHASFAA